MPETFKCVGDSAFFGESDYVDSNYGYLRYELVITGAFPTIGKLSLWGTDYDCFYPPHHVTIAIDNRCCTEITDRDTGFLGIYSSDSSTLYFVNYLPWEEFRLPVHTRVIGARVFEYGGDIAVIIPSGVDSIGDYAFANVWRCYVTGKPQNKYRPEDGWDSRRFVCEAVAPPKLGKEVFFAQGSRYHEGMYWEYNFYVPDESVDIYKHTEGWKDFYEIRPISRILAPDRLSSACMKNTILQKTGDGYLLKSDKPMKAVAGYSMSGERLWVVYPASVDSEIEFPRLGTNRLLLKVRFVDGTQEAFKLVY